MVGHCWFPFCGTAWEWSLASKGGGEWEEEEDCQELIEKTAKKVKSWTTKWLSYAGRLVLVKAVLFSIQIYWGSHFILPKKVCCAIEQILRRFLWSGTELKPWGSKVAWEEVCKPKKEGGLGIRRIKEWNRASMMRYIWAICTKSPSLWVHWCHHYLLKGKCFWEIKPPTNCSWTWRKLLQLREEACRISRYKVGNGISLSLWYSNWHPLGPLLPKFGPRIAYDAALPLNAKVNCIIDGENWKWPYPCTWELREVIIQHPPSYMPNSHNEDQFIWGASRKGNYCSASTWNAIRSRIPKVNWHQMVWFSHHIPRHCFITWLAIWGRLTTKDRMMNWGVNVDPKCIFCGSSCETMNHLFFLCPFSADLRARVMALCYIDSGAKPWDEEILWATGKFSGKSPMQLVRRLAWASLLYHTWNERNKRIFTRQVSTVTTIVQRLKHEVKTKLMSLVNFDISLLDHWGS